MNDVEAFVQLLGPKLYRAFKARGVKNLDKAYDHAMRQLAHESNYGRSPVAKKLHNYGGYGWDGKTYTTFKNDLAFVDAYADLMTKRYYDALNAQDVSSFAKALKNRGYYEAPLEEYAASLTGMKSLGKIAAAHMAANPNDYAVSGLEYRPTQQELLHSYIQPADAIKKTVLTGRVVLNPDGKYSVVDTNIPSAQAYENADRTARIASTQVLNIPVAQTQPKTIEGPTLQDTTVYGRLRTPRLTVPSLMDTHRQYLNYQMLKNAGMIDEDDNDDFLKYVAVNNLFAPVQKYKWGKDAPITLDSNKTYTIDNSAEDVWKDYLNDNLLSILKSAWKDSRNYRNFLKQNALVEDMTGELEDAAFNNWVQSKKGNRLINRTIKNTRKSYYDLYGNDIQSMFDGAKWANDYYNSLTYKDLKANAGIQSPSFSAQGPLRIRFTLDGDNSFYRSLNNMEMSPEINFGLRGPSGIYKNDKIGTNPYWIGAHEYAHYIDSRDLSGVAHAFYPDSYNAIFDARHMPEYADDNPNKQYNYDLHDGTTTENYADFVANRAAMAKAGLYNSLDPNAKISMRNIQKYRKKYGNSDRLFQMYSDQDIYNMYNTIAYNPVQNLNMPYIT